MTVAAWEAEALVDLARRQKVFLMEAMWTRFLPAIGQVRQWLAEGTIGELRQIRADFGYNATFNPNGRMYNKALAGRLAHRQLLATRSLRRILSMLQSPKCRIIHI